MRRGISASEIVHAMGAGSSYGGLSFIRLLRSGPVPAAKVHMQMVTARPRLRSRTRIAAGGAP
jgi:hypothetical protein